MTIADLSSLGLSAEAVANRVNGIGGSDANIIMSGDEAAILALWEEKTGRRPPTDLSGVLPVVMGQFTEPLNAAWFMKQTGININQRNVPLAKGWRTATLDGLLTENMVPLAIWEAKHVNAFGNPDDSLAKYQPQLHHTMSVAGVDRAYLSVFRGNMDWVYFDVTYDADYGKALEAAEWDFWMAVQADDPPVPYPAPPAPKADATREVDLSSLNSWVALAKDWLSTREQAKVFEVATKGLKELVEADVKRAFGGGVQAKRSKAGAITISEDKA